MKVALIIEHFDATRGAAEHLAVFVARELARRGHEVHVICHDVSARINRYRQATQRASHDADLSHRAHPTAEVAYDGIHIHRLRGMRLNTGFGFKRFGARARRWCQTHDPDVVHSMTIAFPGDVYHACAGVYAAMQTQAAATRTTDAATRLKRILLRLSGKQRALLALEALAARSVSTRRWGPAPRRIISLCQMMTTQFNLFYGVNGERLLQLPHPRMDIETDTPRSPAVVEDERSWFRGNYHLAATDRVALFVGHDFRRKGLRHAIEAIAHTRTGWKLVVVGLGKAKEYVELADALGIGDASSGEARILFVGPTRQLDRIYPAADALLLPTFYDPFGLVALQAFNHGLPVISTEFLGPGDLVRKYDAGTIVPSPRSVEEMAAALDALPLAGTSEHAALAKRARAAGLGISPGDYMDALLALYSSLRKD